MGIKQPLFIMIKIISGLVRKPWKWSKLISGEMLLLLITSKNEKNSWFRLILTQINSKINPKTRVVNSERKENMFEKNKDFYPTPKRVIEKMMDGIQLELAHTILEPSAGSGNIVEWF